MNESIANDIGTEPLHSVCREWINERYLTDESLEQLRLWYRDRPRRPLVLNDFLLPEKALVLQQCLARLPLWERAYGVLAEDESVVDLPLEEWLACPVERRWNSQDIARPFTALVDPDGPLPVADVQAIREFFFFAFLGPGFRNWLEEIVRVPIQQTVTCEVVRYQMGDYITSHADTHDSRIVGVNFYLGENWQPGDGGELGYANEQGESIVMTPQFNAISIIPIHTDCVHWVQPWQCPTPGRQTICLSYRPG